MSMLWDNTTLDGAGFANSGDGIAGRGNNNVNGSSGQGPGEEKVPEIDLDEFTANGDVELQIAQLSASMEPI